MYKRRKIEKEIKKLLKQNPIKYKEILEIHGRYGIWFEGALWRKNNLSPKNAFILFKRAENMISWELSIGLYPGILFGVRSYINDSATDHVLYIPFIELCFTIYKDG